MVESRVVMSRLFAFAVLLAACGPKPTDPPPADGPPDPPPDSPPVTGCDYTETRDTTNDDVPPATGTPEDTGITFSQKTVICGNLDAGHFDGDITADVDGYVITLASAADVLVRLHGAGAEAIEFVGMDIYTGAAFDQLAGTVTFYGDHGVTAVHLTPGTYELSAFALASQAIDASVAYQITIDVDDPVTRCPSVVSGTAYAEAGDGGSNNGNDMVTVPSSAPPALTGVDDTAEPTGFTITGTSKQRLGGLLVDVAQADQYEDKDTYLVTTGDANELAVKLDWNSAANLDYLVFEAENASPIKRAITASNIGPEYETFPVKPSTSYWLLVGAKTGSTFPTAYSASLCGNTFVP